MFEDGDYEHLGLKWRTFGEEMLRTPRHRRLQEVGSWEERQVVEVCQPPTFTKSETRSLRLRLRISSLQIWRTTGSRATPANIS